MPTLLDLSETDDPGTIHGKSIADVLQGKADQHHDFAISLPYLGSDSCPVTVVKDRWTAILYPRRSSGKRVIDRAVDGYEKTQDTEQVANQDMLFDVVNDPAQIHDIQAKHGDIVEELRSDLIHHLKKVGTNQEFVNRWLA